MSYRFMVWNADHKPVRYAAVLQCDKYGINDTVELEVTTYSEAIDLKRRLKKSYLAGRGWNTDNPDKYLKTLCWPK